MCRGSMGEKTLLDVLQKPPLRLSCQSFNQIHYNYDRSDVIHVLKGSHSKISY